jgi:hypothetical protein
MMGEQFRAALPVVALLRRLDTSVAPEADPPPRRVKRLIVDALDRIFSPCPG